MSVSDRRERSARRFGFGDWQVRVGQNLIERGAERVVLEPKVMDVLLCLADHAGEVVSADQLLIECWRGSFYGDNPVHKAIALLRKALGDASQQPRYIATIRKRGYQVLVPVSLPENYQPAPLSPAPAWTDGSPFRGLAPFDAAHGEVFFGRSRAIADVLAALREQVRAGCGFVLLVGPSGSGKTSLVRAGVLPMLAREGGFDAARLLSHAYLDAKAGDLSGTAALARALGQWRVDEQPLFADASEPAFAERLLADPSQLLARIEQTLAAQQSAEQPPLMLALVVDQLEGMLSGDPAMVAAVFRVLGALAQGGRVIVLALCRSDYYHALTEVPELLELKGVAGHYDVRPPSLGEIAQMIRRPAQAAGLTFERDPSGELGLDEVLLEQAGHTAGSLPLLQYVLQELYDRRDAQSQLGFAAYHEIGGIAGGLSRQAERIYLSLPLESRATLFEVLPLLTRVAEGEQGAIARQARFSDFRTPAQRALVERFIDARLFVSESQLGEPVVSVAHEALLRQWARAREWVEHNHELLRVRGQLSARARRWSSEGRHRDLLLPSGRLLDEALPLLDQPQLALDAGEREFLLASRRRARRGQVLRMATIGSIVLLALVASVAGIFAVKARHEAERGRDQAESLIGFMLDDLSNKLRPLARLDVLEAVSKRALDHLTHLPAEATNDAALLQRATALRQIGDIENEQGNSAAAAASLEQAEQILRPLEKGRRTDFAVIREQGQVAFYLGAIAYARGQLDQAAHYWGNYRSAAERMMQRQPNDPDSWLELSYALNNLGTLANARQDYAQAIDVFGQSAELKRKVLAQRPDDQAARADLADTLSWLSTAREAIGQPAAALALYGEQVALLGSVLTQSSDASAWLYRLAVIHGQWGRLAARLGKQDEAVVQFTEAVASLRKLVPEDPKRLQWQYDLAANLDQLGWYHSRTGSFDAGDMEVANAASILDVLIRQAATPERINTAALVHKHLAELALQRSQWPIAHREMAQVHNLLDPLLATSGLANELMASTLQSEGRLNMAEQHPESARQLWQRGLQLLANKLVDAQAPWNKAVAADLLLDLGRDGDATNLIHQLDTAGYAWPAMSARVFVPPN